MGRLLSYSGISTKIRAMQSKLISESEIQEMLQFTSVSHAAAWLKRTPEYAKAWADLDENSTSPRSDRKTAPRLRSLKIFPKYYQFANPEQRKFLDLYSRRYEIRVLKEIHDQSVRSQKHRCRWMFHLTVIFSADISKLDTGLD